VGVFAGFATLREILLKLTGSAAERPTCGGLPSLPHEPEGSWVVKTRLIKWGVAAASLVALAATTGALRKW
jgi:hypothetical protein